MLARLNPWIVVRAHWRSLQIRTIDKSTPDRAARSILVGVPVAVGVLLLVTTSSLQNPGVLVSALSLFSAGLLAAFAQLANIRGKYPSPTDDYDPDRLTREMLDESIAHILTAALLSVITAVIVVVGMNWGDAAGQKLNLTFSVIVSMAGSYMLLVFMMTIRKLYGAYALANEVDLTKIGR